MQTFLVQNFELKFTSTNGHENTCTYSIKISGAGHSQPMPIAGCCHLANPVAWSYSHCLSVVRVFSCDWGNRFPI